MVVSEKALATAKGLLVDEGRLKPSATARFLAGFWMRVVWGYLLAPLARLRGATARRFRTYPLPEGARHKELALRYAGLLQALRPMSEGGIDVGNLPYSYACLPLPNPQAEAERVRQALFGELGVRVGVMVVDTDKTYSLGRFHITPRPKPLPGIAGLGGFATYLLCRLFKLKPRATPLALAGLELPVETALELAEAAHQARGYGAGRTQWDIAARFGVSLTGVSWDMLASIPHTPLVLIRWARRPNTSLGLRGALSGRGRACPRSSRPKS